MPEQEDHELDVDFEIIEDPEDLVFPRLPNVVSHRGHRVKIIATVHDVPQPDRTTDITLSAFVNVLNNALLNEKGHICHPFQQWGTSKDLTVTFPSEQYSRLPFKIETIVSRDAGDDHLGQGPDYEAFVDVSTSSAQLAPTEEETGGTRPRGAAASASDATPRTEGSYLIRFTSK
jgi:hypothetical protein